MSINNWTNLKPRLRFATEPEVENPPSGGGTTKTDPPADDKDEALGDAGKRALDAERKARRDAESKLRKFEEAEEARKKSEMTEVERLKAEKAEVEQRAKAREIENLRYRVGTSIPGFPTGMIDRLRGETEAEIKADAEELLKLVPSNDSRRGPRGDRSQGPKDKSSAPSKKELFGETIDELFDR